jgi:hypothetical protein
MLSKLSVDPAVVVFGGTALALIGAFVSAIGFLKAERERARFEHELRNRSDEIAALNRDLAKANLAISNYLSGGDSYAYVDFFASNGQIVNSGNGLGPDEVEDVIVPRVMVKGSNPVYDIRVNVYEPGVDEKNLAAHANEPGYWLAWLKSNTYNLGTIGPGGDGPGGDWQRLTTFDWRDHSQKHELTITIHQRNGIVSQTIRAEFGKLTSINESGVTESVPGWVISQSDITARLHDAQGNEMNFPPLP